MSCYLTQANKPCFDTQAEYDAVLMLDMDTLVLKPLDELIRSVVRDNISLAFTYDDSLDSAGSAAPPINGGFLLLRPNRQVPRRPNPCPDPAATLAASHFTGESPPGPSTNQARLQRPAAHRA
jgi:hypothetical protein